MAENIKIYPGRHFSIDEIKEVYLAYIDPVAVNWETVETNARLGFIQTRYSSPTDTFYQSVFDTASSKAIPSFNIIAIYANPPEGSSNPELLSYAILGVPQVTNEAAFWYVNITLEWNSKNADESQIAISLLRVYKSHTVQTASPDTVTTGDQSSAGIDTISKIHEKLAGLSGMPGNTESQIELGLYNSRACYLYSTVTSPTSLQTLGDRYTNNNLLFYRRDMFTDFGKLEKISDATYGEHSNIDDSDISNGGVMVWERGSKNNYYDDVLTYTLDNKRASGFETQSRIEKDNNGNSDIGNKGPSKNFGDAYQSASVDIGDTSTCIIGNFVFPELLAQIKNSFAPQEEHSVFLHNITESYKLATLYFDLKKGMGLFIPLHAYKCYVILPCGTSDMNIRIFHTENTSFEFPEIKDILPILYPQQDSYFVQYENGRNVYFNIKEVEPQKVILKNETIFSESITTDVTRPSNPWCFPENTGDGWEATNDMPDNYTLLIYNSLDFAEDQDGIVITPHMNVVGIAADLSLMGPVDTDSFFKYYQEVVGRLKTALANPIDGNVVIKPFDGISFKILDNMFNGQLDSHLESYIANDAISYPIAEAVDFTEDNNLTYEELYAIYIESYKRVVNSDSNAHNLLPHYFSTVKKGIKPVIDYKSVFYPKESSKVFTFPEFSSLDWDTLSVIGNSELENLQFTNIKLGLTNAFKAIRNLYELYINSLKDTNDSWKANWMFCDNAVVISEKDDDYQYITIIKYSDRYGTNIFRQVIPMTSIDTDSLKINYSSDVLTLKFQYIDANQNHTNYTSLYDLNTKNPHKPVASIYSQYDYEERINENIFGEYKINIYDMYYSNGVLLQTETLTDTTSKDYYSYRFLNTDDGNIWYRTSGIRLLRKIFNQYQ